MLVTGSAFLLKFNIISIHSNDVCMVGKRNVSQDSQRIFRLDSKLVERISCGMIRGLTGLASKPIEGRSMST